MDLFGSKAHEKAHRDTAVVLRRLVEQVSQLSINLGQTRMELRKLSLKVDGKVERATSIRPSSASTRPRADSRVKLGEVAEAAAENWNQLSEQLEEALDEVNERTAKLADDD